MGLSLRQSLEHVLTGDADFEAKTFAAVVLLKIGCTTGVNHLISALELQTPGAGMIASALSEAGIREAADVIAEILRSVAPAWAGPSGKELAVPRGCVLHTERVQAAEVGRIVSGVSKPD
jgi:hypothetical protein